MTTALEVIDTGEVVQQMTTEEASSVTTQIRIKLDAIADNHDAVIPLIRDAITRRAWSALGYNGISDYVADRFDGALSRLGIDTRRALVQELSAAGLSTRAIAPVVGVTHKTVVKDRQALTSGGTQVPPDAVPPIAVCPDCGNDLDGDTCPGCYPSSADTVDMGEGAALDDDETALYDAPEAPDDVLGFTDPDDPDDDDDPALTDEECRALADPDDLDEEPEPARITGTDGRSYPATKPAKANRKPLPDAFWRATFDLRKGVERITRLSEDDRFKKNADQIRERNLSDLIRARDALQCVIDQLSA